MNAKELKQLAVPVSAALLALFLVVSVVKDLFKNTDMPRCTTRYPSPTEFSLKSQANQPLTPIELQSRAGVFEWGVLENAKVEAKPDAPSPLVMSVRLPKGGSSKFVKSETKGGVSFRWQPRNLAGAQSACLAYSVYLPDDFQFGDGGELPGLFGGKAFDPNIAADGKNGFSTRVLWDNEGRATLLLHAPSAELTGIPHLLYGHGGRLVRGRWVSIEQEAVLNTPGMADGLARLWIDGVLAKEITAVIWRDKLDVTMSGALMDVWYGGHNRSSAAPADTTLAVTPMSLRWK